MWKDKHPELCFLDRVARALMEHSYYWEMCWDCCTKEQQGWWRKEAERFLDELDYWKIGYKSFEDARFLEQKTSAYTRVLEQAADFMKREAFMWKNNAELLSRALKAEQEVKELKQLTEDQDKEEEKSNVVPFERPKIAPAAKDPPGDNWLKDLPVGTGFLTRPIDPRYTLPWLEEYEVVRQGGRWTYLFRSDEHQDINLRVDNARFSRQMIKFEEFPPFPVTEGTDE